MYDRLPRRGLAGLSGTCATVPLVTTSVNCDNAQASVNQMNSVFQSLGSPSQYQAQIDSINASIANSSSWYYTFGMCATAFNIGIQADTLTSQMLSDAGQIGVVGPTCGDVAPIGLPGIQALTAGVAGLGLGALAVGALALYFFVYKK